MPRCSYLHDDFKVGNGHLHDGTNQCWMTDVGNFVSNENSEHYCLFHASLDKEPSDRNDWPIEQRGTMQADQLKLLLEQWNTENKESKTDKPLSFVLPKMQCGTLNLTGFIFSGDALFSSATFSDDTLFGSATFIGDANFNSTTFTGDANFDSATFSGVAQFDSTRFSGEADFNDATFSGGALFRKATFSSRAEFEVVTFSGSSEFNNVIFSGTAGFNNATFTDNANFTNAEFKSTTDFSKVIFVEVPYFHNAELHQSTDFRGAIFEDKGSRAAPSAYRTLKIAMGDVRSKKEEADFYAYEMESNLKQYDTHLFVKLFTYFYCAFSDYGRSFMRPLVWLLLITIFFSMIYSVLLVHSNNSDILPHNSPYYIQFTIEQIVKPFSIWTQKGSEVIRSSVPDKVLVFQILTSLQSIMSIALITLFLLAVRRKFKLE